MSSDPALPKGKLVHFNLFLAPELTVRLRVKLAKAAAAWERAFERQQEEYRVRAAAQGRDAGTLEDPPKRCFSNTFSRTNVIRAMMVWCVENLDDETLAQWTYYTARIQGGYGSEAYKNDKVIHPSFAVPEGYAYKKNLGLVKIPK